jgi:hypothetical protein
VHNHKLIPFTILDLKLQNKIEQLMLPVADIRPVNIMRRLLFAYVIFNFVQMLPYLDTLYGRFGLVATQHLTGFTLTTLVNLLSVDAIKNYYLMFFAVQLLFALICLLGFLPRICSLVVFFTTINLQNRIYSTVSGGDILLCLMLFYLSFISNGKKLKNSNFNQIQNAFDRAFIFMCKAQLIIVYAVSAIFKLQSPQWLDGSAMQQILSIDEYSIPALQNMVCSAPLLFKILTWAALLYQTVFPVLIFVKRVKNYLLFSGVIFHLFIAFAMGLFNFGIIMICCYTVFYDFKKKPKPNEAFP